MELKRDDRWLCRMGQNPLIEFVIIEVSPSRKIFKAHINNGKNVGLVDWFSVESWQFVEQLPSFVLPNESKEQSSTEA